MKYAGWAILFGASFAVVGAVFAEFYPLISGPLALNLCEPLSPCRNDLVPGYAGIGAFAGVILGLVIALILNQKKLAKT